MQAHRAFVSSSSNLSDSSSATACRQPAWPRPRTYASSIRGLRTERRHGRSSARAISSSTLIECSHAAVVHASSVSCSTPAAGVASARARSTAERIASSAASAPWALRLDDRRRDMSDDGLEGGSFAPPLEPPDS
eukprot:7382677-Prymnesium_polylepis.2